MRRAFVIIATVLSLLATSCGSDTVTTGGELDPTPRPAPTIEGEIIEVEEQEYEAEIVLIGVSADQTVQVHALPGVDQPLVSDVPPGTSIEPMGERFETEDGLIWWQVRAGDREGWIQPNVAYQGPAQDVTDQALQLLGADAGFASADESANAVAAKIATDQGAPEIIVVERTEIAGQGSATVTIDLLGLQDDSLIGFRLIIASALADVDGASLWRPASVIQLPLCARGVSPQGACV